MELKDMIRMANQIADFNRPYPRANAVKEIADHINRFWEPRMRKDFFAHMAKGGEGFDALVREAAAQVRKPRRAPHDEAHPVDPLSGLPREAHEA